MLLGYGAATDYLRPTIGYVSGGEGPKMINQYFNVYALRRVRTAGYATDIVEQCCHCSVAGHQTEVVNMHIN